MDNIFENLFSADSTSVGIVEFLLCLITACFIGFVFCFIFSRIDKYSKNFLLTVAIIPVVVTVIILMVNGSLGSAVAVAGAFSLVRFRSVPGTFKEIAILFVSTATGIIIGTGYIAYAILFVIVIILFMLLLKYLGYGSKVNIKKILSITIPESLNYNEIFIDLFEEYTESNSLLSIKTSNMGSLYKLKYEVVLKKDSKEFIDELRCRNGNLEISISMSESE